MRSLAIAGKNQIAVNGLSEAIRVLGKAGRIFAVHNRNDDGLATWQPSFKAFARSQNVAVVPLDDLYEVKDLVFISLEFDRIIRPARFHDARLYNVHFSRLPAYKGMYTSAWPLIKGETESGVTLHEIDSGIDTGGIIDQQTFPLPVCMTSSQLYDAYQRHAFMLFRTWLPRLLSGEVLTTPQPGEGASYYGKATIDYGSLQIDTGRTAWEVHNQLRAFTFRPYQLPKLGDVAVSATRLTTTRSIQLPGTLTQDEKHVWRLATIDYDLMVFEDRFGDALNAIRDDDAEVLGDILAVLPHLVSEQTREGLDLLGHAKACKAEKCMRKLA